MPNTQTHDLTKINGKANETVSLPIRDDIRTNNPQRLFRDLKNRCVELGYEIETESVSIDREAVYLDRFLESGDRILDIGAGLGSIEERLPDHDIIGLDVSEAMVQTARTRVDDQFIVGDAWELPITTDTVDVVFFVATLEFIP